MIKALLSDFSQVILFPKDSDYVGSLNSLYAKKKDEQGFSFFDLYFVNTELLDFYQELKQKYNIELTIYTTGTVQNHPDLQSHLTSFSRIFSVADIGKDKRDVESYQFLSEQLNVLPEEMMFIDDSMSNVSAAREAGVQGIQFISNNQIKSEVIKLL